MAIKKILLLLGFIGIISISFSASCKKEKKTNYLSDEIKAYLDFKEGSYWIYRDVATKQEDSSYVYNYGTYINESNGNPIWYSEIITYSQKWKGEEIRIDILPDLGKEPKFYSAEYNVNRDNGTCCITEPLFALNEKGNPSADIYIGSSVQYFDTLKTLDTFYTNVYKFEAVFNGYNILKSAYFKRNVGIVKIEFRDSSNTVYELVRHQVVQ